MRQATPCPTVLSAPDHRLKTTPTLPGWMMVNEAHPAATMKKTMASTTPLASAAGPEARTSSVIAPGYSATARGNQREQYTLDLLRGLHAMLAHRHLQP